MLETLKNKREALLNELASKTISNNDIDEIEKKVAEYREKLIAEKTSLYVDEAKAINAKVDLLDELIKENTPVEPVPETPAY